jgi:LysR family transcriptional regulator of gallate degradation
VEVEVLHDDSVTVVAAADLLGDGVAGGPAGGVAEAGDLAELVDASWVLPTGDTSLRQQIDEAFVRQAGRVPRDVVECVAPMPTRRMVLEGRRLAVVPAGVFADDFERGDLVSLNIDIPGTSIPIGIITRAGADQPASVAKLVAALRRGSKTLFDS